MQHEMPRKLGNKLDSRSKGLTRLGISLSFLLMAFLGGQSKSFGAVWPNQGAYITTASESIPPFPNKLSGYTSKTGQDFWGKPFRSKGTIRVFQAAGWQGIPGFPNTMNGCSAVLFMIRWRSGNPEVRVQSSVRYSAGTSAPVKTGAFGYMAGSNCEQPMFSFGDTLNANKSNLVDIYYELKFWQAAP